MNTIIGGTMIKSVVTTQSKWKENLKHDYFDLESDTLVVMLPGSGHTVEGPLFYYLIGEMFDLGYDVLGVNYGFHFSQEKPNLEEMTQLENEIFDTISKVKSYKKYVFIAKSLGTRFLQSLHKKYGGKCVYLTPTDIMLTYGIAEDSIFVYGDADKTLSEENRRLLSNYKTHVVIGGNHSLLSGGLKENLNHVIDFVKFVKDEI